MMYNGIFNVYKPLGMTSFDVVSIMRRLTNTRKIGHTGTLDPQAEGVLTVCVGEALKCVEYMTEKDKVYIATICFGTMTNTQDATGQVTQTSDVRISTQQLKQLLETFQGKQLQTPPLYSALKVNGKKYYELARAGEAVKGPDPREIEVYGIQLLDATVNTTGLIEEAVLEIHCSKGTYIRTLCHDIGLRAGSVAHMKALKRVRAGQFSAQEAYTIEQLEQLQQEGRLEMAMQPMDKAFFNCPEATFDAANLKRILNGIPIRLYLLPKEQQKSFEEGMYVRIYDAEGSFRAVGKAKRDTQGMLLKGYRIFQK